MNRVTVALPCGCVQVVRINRSGTCLGRRVKACGPGGVHDGMRWPPFGVLLEEACPTTAITTGDRASTSRSSKGDLEITFSRKLTKDGVLEQMITAYPKGYVAACSCVAVIKANL